MAGDATRKKVATFYIERLLPEHVSRFAHARVGAEGVYALSADELAA